MATISAWFRERACLILLWLTRVPIDKVVVVRFGNYQSIIGYEITFTSLSNTYYNFILQTTLVKSQMRHHSDEFLWVRKDLDIRTQIPWRIEIEIYGWRFWRLGQGSDHKWPLCWLFLTQTMIIWLLVLFLHLSLKVWLVRRLSRTANHLDRVCIQERLTD